MKQGMSMDAFARLSSKYYVRWYTDGTGLTKEALSFSYDLIKAAGFERTLFYDQDVPPSNKKFLDFLLSGKYLVFQSYREDGTPVIMYWFEPFLFTGKQYLGHFTTFGTVPKDELVECTHQSLHFLADTFPMVELYGLTPCCLRHAWKFAHDVIGYEKITTIKSCVYCLGKERDAIFSVCKLKEKWG